MLIDTELSLILSLALALLFRGHLLSERRRRRSCRCPHRPPVCHLLPPHPPTPLSRILNEPLRRPRGRPQKWVGGEEGKGLLMQLRGPVAFVCSLTCGLQLYSPFSETLPGFQGPNYQATRQGRAGSPREREEGGERCQAYRRDEQRGPSAQHPG